MADWIQRFVECYPFNKPEVSRIEEATVLRYKHRPKSVFKYRVNDARSRENLKNDLVWLSKPSAYNDPYDSSLAMASDEASRIRLAETMSRFHELLGDDGEARRIRKILATPTRELHASELNLEDALADPNLTESTKRLLDSFVNLHSASARKLLRGLGSALKDNLKVCSFATTQHSLIMWSHYGDSHRGFCIEYDTDAMAPLDPFMKALFPVIYSEKLFDGTGFAMGVFGLKKGLNLDYLTLAVLHKSPEWNYEQEWRLVVRPPDSDEKSLFKVPVAKRVYLGSLMPESEREEISSICVQKGIELFEVHLATDAFRLFSEKVFT